MGDALNFKTHAKKAFSFLVEECGYAITESDATRIRFENGFIRVGVVFDAFRSYQLDVTVRQRNELTDASKTSAYSLGEVLGCAEAKQAGRLQTVQVTTERVLVAFLEEMAAALRTYGTRLIAGDVAAFRELARCRARTARAHATARRLAQARQRAHTAWDEGDYCKVVLLLSERERLEVAKRRCSWP